MKKGKDRNVGRFNLENYQHPDAFGQWLGYRLKKVDIKKHRAEAYLKIRKDHLSPALRVHGGVISAFFDFAFGATVFTTLGPQDFCSTVELKVNYLKPIALNDEIVAKAEVVFLGKRLCVLQGFLYKKGNKEPVSMATATFNVVSASRG